MAALILFCIGLACIVFSKQATKVLQALIDHLVKRQSRRRRTPVADEDKVISPMLTVIIGIVIIGLAAFAHLQAK